MSQKMHAKQVKILMGRSVSNLVRGRHLVHGIALYGRARVLIALRSAAAARHQNRAPHSEAAQLADQPLKIHLGPADLIG
jgi:hypothetical protein